MDGDVILFRRTGKGKRVVLPDGDFGAAQKDVLDLLAENNKARLDITYLSSTGRGVLFLDLDLTHVAGMLNDLGNVRLVSSPNLTRDTLSEVRESTIHPVLPEDTDTIAKGRKVWLDHAESTVD